MGEETAVIDKPADGDVTGIDAAKAPPDPTNLADVDAEGKPIPEKGPAADKPAQPDSQDKADKAPVVPEKYADPKLPDGYVLDKDVNDKFIEFAKANKLPQEMYQKGVDLWIEAAEKNKAETLGEWEKIKAGWIDDSKKAFGKDFSKELGLSAKAIDRVFSPEENTTFRELLKDSGIGNHPLMIKLCSFIGKAISEDRLIEGKSGPASGDKDPAEVMFPNLPPK